MTSDTYDEQKRQDEARRQASVRENQCIERIAVTMAIVCVVCLIAALIHYWGGK